MRDTVLHHSVFKPNPKGHGGERRTGQISELLQENSIEIQQVDYQITTNYISRLAAGIRFSRSQALWPSPIWRFGYFGFPSKVYNTSFKAHTGKKLLVWEANRDSFEVAPLIAKQSGFNVIALPHNLESLVSASLANPLSESKLAEFSRELFYLSKADAVFCISREEAWLLHQWGVPADYLPYYPPQEIANDLLEIRYLRESTEKDQFLILGTVKNQPTFDGILAQLNLLSQIRQAIPITVSVAGYGSETLEKYCSFPGLNFYGSVSQEKLRDLLINTKAILVHQVTGVGALTRIPEMLVAGIPVIANSHASRSSFEYSGIYTYDTSEEIADLLTKNFDQHPILPRPIQAEKRFVSTVRKFLEKS